MYNLNKRRVIRVVTAVGETEEEEVNEGLGQGTLEAGILSSVSVDNGLNDFFGDSPHEIIHINIRLQPMAYQDDIIRASKSVEDARAGIAKLEAMAESKNLNYNTKKSCLMIIRSKKKTEKV